MSTAGERPRDRLDSMRTRRVVQRARMAGIFVCYRRADSAAETGRLCDRLAHEFPGDIFIDVDSVSIGENFVEAIDQALDKTGVVLVVIGPTWLTDSGDGTRTRSASRSRVRSDAAPRSCPSSCEARQCRRANSSRRHCAS